MPDTLKLAESGVIDCRDRPKHGRYLHHEQTPICCRKCQNRDTVDLDLDYGDGWLNYCRIGLILPTKSNACKRRVPPLVQIKPATPWSDK